MPTPTIRALPIPPLERLARVFRLAIRTIRIRVRLRLGLCLLLRALDLLAQPAAPLAAVLHALPDPRHRPVGPTHHRAGPRAGRDRDHRTRPGRRTDHGAGQAEDVIRGVWGLREGDQPETGPLQLRVALVEEQRAAEQTGLPQGGGQVVELCPVEDCEAGDARTRRRVRRAAAPRRRELPQMRSSDRPPGDGTRVGLGRDTGTRIDAHPSVSGWDTRRAARSGGRRGVRVASRTDAASPPRRRAARPGPAGGGRARPCPAARRSSDPAGSPGRRARSRGRGRARPARRGTRRRARGRGRRGRPGAAGPAGELLGGGDRPLAGELDVGQRLADPAHHPEIDQRGALRPAAQHHVLGRHVAVDEAGGVDRGERSGEPTASAATPSGGRGPWVRRVSARVSPRSRSITITARPSP